MDREYSIEVFILFLLENCTLFIGSFMLLFIDSFEMLINDRTNLLVAIGIYVAPKSALPSYYANTCQIDS